MTFGKNIRLLFSFVRCFLYCRYLFS